MYIIMLGAPGSGKGTQAGLISKRLGIPHISTGDLLRKNPHLPPEIAKKMAQGFMLEDSDVLSIVKERISRPDAKKGWVLDGFPRTLSQAHLLKKMFPDIVICPIYLQISDAKIQERLSNRRTCEKCGHIYHLINQKPKKTGICDSCGGALILRNDDNPAVISKRLSVYHEVTAPLVDFYRKEGNLVVIDCSHGDSPEAVDQMIRKIIY